MNNTDTVNPEIMGTEEFDFLKVGNVSLPDSKLVSEANEIALNALDSRVYAHSIRSYLYAALYANKHQLTFDEEGLATAFLFHDFGFQAPYAQKGVAFQVASSLALKSFLQKQSVSPERIVPLMKAIDFHVQLLPRWNKGNEATLLHIGAWMDVTGLRSRQLASTHRRQIKQAYSPKGFRSHFCGCVLKNMLGLKSGIGMIVPSLCQSEYHYQCHGA